MNTTWQCLSVKEFVDKCNWQGVLSTTVSLPRLQDVASWRCLTTQKFFSLSNWDGRSILATGDRKAIEQTFVFDLTLPSEQFWQCFSWSAPRPTNRANEVLQETQEIIAAVEEFTLNDLSQLF